MRDHEHMLARIAEAAARDEWAEASKLAHEMSRYCLHKALLLTTPDADRVTHLPARIHR